MHSHRLLAFSRRQTLDPQPTNVNAQVAGMEELIRRAMGPEITVEAVAAIEAEDGNAGLQILESKRRIDLLITDFGLQGGMNGRQLADAGAALRPGLKILFITGYAENAVIGNGHLKPGMHVLTKPFAMDTLANRISAILT